MDLDLSEEVYRLEYVDLDSSSSRFKRLCRNCDDYSRKKRFKDGDHTLRFRATDFAGNVGTAEVSFSVE